MRNLLITGATEKDRFLYAIDLANKHLCSKSNLIIVGPEGLDKDGEIENYAEIKLEQVSKIIEENHKRNFDKGPAIYLITHAHLLTKQAANALLKTIEENNKDKFIFALAPLRSSVLPTITSRLTPIRLKPTSVDKGINKELVELLINITRTKPHLRVGFTDVFAQEKNGLIKQLQDFLHSLHMLIRPPVDKNLSFEEARLIGRAIFSAQTLLKRNVNVKLIIEEMLFNNWPFFAKENFIGRKL